MRRAPRLCSQVPPERRGSPPCSFAVAAPTAVLAAAALVAPLTLASLTALPAQAAAGADGHPGRQPAVRAGLRGRLATRPAPRRTWSRTRAGGPGAARSTVPGRFLRLQGGGRPRLGRELRPRRRRRRTARWSWAGETTRPRWSTTTRPTARRSSSQGVPGRRVTAADRSLARASLRSRLTRERFYFLMADRFANGSTRQRPRRPDRRPAGDGLRPDGQGLLPRGRPHAASPSGSTTSRAWAPRRSG